MAVACCTLMKEDRQPSMDELLVAATKLGFGGLKLYIYLASLRGAATLYERKEFVRLMDTDWKVGNRAFDDLMANGYVVPESDKIFYFYLTPCEN